VSERSQLPSTNCGNFNPGLGEKLGCLIRNAIRAANEHDFWGSPQLINSPSFMVPLGVIVQRNQVITWQEENSISNVFLTI